MIAALQESLRSYDIGNHHLISEFRARLAQYLADLLPGDLTYTIFGVGGGKAIDLALKLARGVTRRQTIDNDLLRRFEAGLDPQVLENSAMPGEIIGYGEISAIFRIQGDDRNAYKRLPIFEDRPAAERYRNMHVGYCGLLEKAGLRLPPPTARTLSRLPAGR